MHSSVSGLAPIHAQEIHIMHGTIHFYLDNLPDSAGWCMWMCRTLELMMECILQTREYNRKLAQPVYILL